MGDANNLYDEYLGATTTSKPRQLKLNARQKDFMKSTLKMRQQMTTPMTGAASGESKSMETEVDLDRELETMTNPM